MNEKETYKLIGKLGSAVVFLSVIVIGLIITILVLFAFQEADSGEEKEEEMFFCGTCAVSSNTRNSGFEVGENLFNQNCSGCHFPHKDMTGPALKGARLRGIENAYEGWIYDFIRNEDSLVQIKDPYTLQLRKNWGHSDSKWTHRERLTNAEIDDLFDYVN